MVNSPLFAKGLLLWCWIPWKFPLIALLSFLGQETVGGLLALVRHHNRLGSLWGQRCSRGSSCQGEGEGGSSCSQRKVEGLINFVCTHGHDYSYYQLTVPPRKDITISHRHCKMLILSVTKIHRDTKCFDVRDVDMWSVGEPLKWADNDTWSVVSARDRGRGQCTHLASIGERGEWCQGENRDESTVGGDTIKLSRDEFQVMTSERLLA